MKPWQHGIELDRLKSLEGFYAPHNQYAISPFGKFKKNDIATALHKDVMAVFYNDGDQAVAAYVCEQSKVPSKIKMFGNVVIGEKCKGDYTFSKLVGDPTILTDQLQSYSNENCWLITYAGNTTIRALAEKTGFEYVGQKVTSFSEVISIYFRNSASAFSPRKHPQVPTSELVSMAEIGQFNYDTDHILDTIKKMCPVFMNHYSNYNQNDAWSALSLRGYSDNASFITKPAEMNDKWKEEHKDSCFELQDTKVYRYFPEIKELLSFLDGDIHRVRFMRLAPGGGELLRHTDQVDPDAGNGIGSLARLHFPIKTNPNVIFSTWNQNDIKENYHFPVGTCWVLDTRKPHMAVNGGNEERIHLVVDTIVTPKLEKMINEGIARQTK